MTDAFEFSRLSNAHRPSAAPDSGGGNGKGGSHESVSDLWPAAPPQALSLQPQTQIGSFLVVQSFTNAGGFQLGRCLDTSTHRSVLLKLAVSPLGITSRAAALLKREKVMADRLRDCPGVLKVYDLHELPYGAGTVLALSMEDADGGSFGDLLMERRGDWHWRSTRGLKLFRHLCQIVAELHDSDAAHLNLSFANVLLSGHTFKLTSLEWSRELNQVLDAGPAGFVPRGAVWGGTPTYMSPEHYSAAHPDDLDARADVYSLGVMAYELLHPRCRPPYGGNGRRLHRLHMRAHIPYLPQVDHLLAQTVGHCLHKNPAKRFANAGELVAELDAIASLPPETERPAPPTEDTRQLWRDARRFVAQGRLTEAMRLCRHLLQTEGENAHADHLLADLERRAARAADLYRDVKRQLRDSQDLDLAQAGRLLLEAESAFPEHPEASEVRRQWQDRSEAFCQARDQAARYAQSGDWESCRQALQRAANLNPRAQALPAESQAAGRHTRPAHRETRLSKPPIGERS